MKIDVTKTILSGSAMAAGLALALSAGGCRKAGAPGVAPYPSAMNDPSNVNMAPVNAQAQNPRQVRRDAQGRVLDEREQGYNSQQGEQYPEQGYDRQGYGPQGYGGQQNFDEADQPPPPLPQGNQPPVTRANTLWTPGYWGHSPNGYYWVPGAYVAPPRARELWTPGYWAADGQRYRFNPGYWGPHVGFYGGVPYGGGYTGTGYKGGYWNGDRFLYNQAVIPVAQSIGQNFYNQAVQQVLPYGPVSYNGGNGGVPLLPIAAELIALHEQHQPALRYQLDLARQSALDRAQSYLYNQGRPQNYYAPDGYIVDRVLNQRGYVQGPDVYGGEDFPGRGEEYGSYKEHHDNGNHFGQRKHEGGDQGEDDQGHGHGNGHGHGHEKD